MLKLFALEEGKKPVARPQHPNKSVQYNFAYKVSGIL